MFVAQVVYPPLNVTKTMKNLMKSFRAGKAAKVMFLSLALTGAMSVLNAQAQQTTEPTVGQCGPLMGNEAGTKFCCGNTNNDNYSANGC